MLKRRDLFSTMVFSFIVAVAAGVDNSHPAVADPTSTLSPIQKHLHDSVVQALNSCNLPDGGNNDIANDITKEFFSEHATVIKNVPTSVPTADPTADALGDTQNSFLHLFDVVSTNGDFDLIGPNDTFGLLGSAMPESVFSSFISPNTGMFLIKEDCLHLVGLAVNGGGRGGLPWGASVKAAFSASATNSQSNSILLVFGALSSPYDVMIRENGEAKTYALFRALNWRLAHDDTEIAHYVSSATIMASGITTSENDKVTATASLDAGLDLPWANFNADSSGSLKGALLATLKSYDTLYWKTSLGQLPTTEKLATALGSSLSGTFANGVIAPKVPVKVDVIVDGWPRDMCDTTFWSAPKFENSSNPGNHLMISSYSLSPGSVNADLFPTCDVTLSVREDNSLDLSDVSLVVDLSPKVSDATIPLTIRGSLTQVDDPKLSLPVVKTTFTADAKPIITWAFTGALDMPPGSSLQSKDVDTATVTCTLADNSVKTLAVTFAKNSTTTIDGSDSLVDLELHYDTSIDGRTYDLSSNGAKTNCNNVKGKFGITRVVGNVVSHFDVEFKPAFAIDFPSIKATATPSPS